MSSLNCKTSSKQLLIDNSFVVTQSLTGNVLRRLQAIRLSARILKPKVFDSFSTATTQLDYP